MSLLHRFINKFGSKPLALGQSPRRRPSRLGVEELEERRVPAVDLLPDLTVWAEQSRGFLYDWYLDTATTPGRTLLRLSTAVPNIGAGALEIRGGEINGNGTQTVYQRIHDDSGAFREQPAGEFIFHAEHGHIHLEDFAQYNLRTVTSGDGVGAVVVSGAKTSFQLEDTTVYNSSMAAPRTYTGGGQVQGISPGWADYYHRSLPGQWIDVTDVANGTYWLEAVADPDNHIQESDETNNAVRIKITIGGANAPDYAGNTPGTALNIGVLNSEQTFQDFVSPTDKNDYYRFTLNSSADFALRMDGLTADADVYLMNSSYSIIARSTLGGSSPEAIARTLSPGTYYVRVYLYANTTTPYVLNMGPGGVAADGAGNTPGTARDLGGLSEPHNLGDSVSTSDTDDYYRFRVTGTHEVELNLRLDHLSGDAGVQLLDEDGAILAHSTNNGTTTETITQTLHSGHAYFVRVFLQSGNSASYSLNLTGTEVTVPDHAGNTMQSARDVGPLTTTQTFEDYVGPEDENDYYRFTLSGASTVSIRLDELSENADVQLLDSNGTVVASSSNTGAAAENISRLLDAGTYFVRVYSIGSEHSEYSLTLSSVLAPTGGSAGNTLQTALDIGPLTGNRTFQDSVNPTERYDYYRFTLASPVTLNLRVDGLTADADVQLFSSTGSIVVNSNNWGTTAESINRYLPAGTYYVRVYPYGNVSTNYTLSLSVN